MEALHFPFVSRARFEDALTQLKEAKAALVEMTKKRDSLTNQLVWRYSRVAIDPEELPAAYRPSSKAPETASDVLNDQPEKQTGPKLVRQQLKEVEAAREKEFLRSMETGAKAAAAAVSEGV